MVREILVSAKKFGVQFLAMQNVSFFVPPYVTVILLTQSLPVEHQTLFREIKTNLI